MTTFSKNPYAEARKQINKVLFRKDLQSTLKTKFKHKQFSERFSSANMAFIGMGAIAQFASLTTAFTMLSYLFVSVHIIARVLCAASLVLMIEAIKRTSTNDVMQGIFQYKEIERFPAILASIAIASSIFISIEGAKILPDLLISDAHKGLAILKSEATAEKDFNNRIAALTQERDKFRENRLYKGRLASKDANIIEKYNEDIKELGLQKDAAKKAIVKANAAALEHQQTMFEKSKDLVQTERKKLGKQLVMAAIGFEVLFLLSMCFSWWYYTECEKERQNTSKVKAELLENKEVETPKVKTETSKVEGETLEVKGGVRSKKIGFVDYEDFKENAIEVEKIKKDYTRICPECKTPFVHKTHNHTYFERACMLAARDKRTKE